MATKGIITVTTVLCFMLGILSPAPAAQGSHITKACCTRYNRKPVPIHLIRGYRLQTTKENCRIDAIILYTVRKNEVCATQEDEWVRKILEWLSSKLKTMSKAGSAAGEIPMRKTGNPSAHDGSGSFFSSTEAFPNNTESFY